MGQPKHILVVDDNGDVWDVIVASLQVHNFASALRRAVPSCAIL
jgi:hypothetical protein